MKCAGKKMAKGGMVKKYKKGGMVKKNKRSGGSGCKVRNA
jgi:hypothetical protein